MLIASQPVIKDIMSGLVNIISQPIGYSYVAVMVQLWCSYDII